jgi:hypothetical protein
MSVVRQGWLEKSSAGKQGLNHRFTKENWQRRYFTLVDGTQPKLVYYKDEGVFTSNGNASGQLMLRGSTAKFGEGAGFEVRAAQRTLPLRCCAGDSSAEGWIADINRLARAPAAASTPAPAGLGGFEVEGGGAAAVAPRPDGRSRPMLNPMDLADETHVFKQGWLQKRSGGSAGGKVSIGEMKKGWDKRWFVLQSERLRYFKTPQDLEAGKKERGSCSVMDIAISEYVSEVSTAAQLAKDLSRSRFKLRAREPDGSERLFTLEAPSPQEMARWIDLVEAICAAQGGGAQNHSTAAPTPAPAPAPRSGGAGSTTGKTFNPMNDLGGDDDGGDDPLAGGVTDGELPCVRPRTRPLSRVVVSGVVACVAAADDHHGRAWPAQGGGERRGAGRCATRWPMITTRTGRRACGRSWAA